MVVKLLAWTLLACLGLHVQENRNPWSNKYKVVVQQPDSGRQHA